MIDVGGLRVAVIGLFPDFGHAQRLLRVGAAIRRRGGTVKGFMASETEPLFSRYDFEIFAMGASDMARGRFLFERLCALPNGLQLHWAIGYHNLINNAFVAPALGRHAADLAEALFDFRPNILVCDDHPFKDVYRHVARSLDLPLVFQRTGALLHAQSPFVRAHGLTSDGEDRRKRFERFVTFTQRPVRRLTNLRYPHLFRRGRRAVRAVDAALSTHFPAVDGPPPREVVLSMGLSSFERRVTHPSLVKPDKGPFELDPTPVIHRSSPATDGVTSWLAEKRAGSVVYVNLGSVVRMPKRFALCLHQALIDIARPVIWSCPADQRNLPDPPRTSTLVRREAFVEQADILRNPAIGLFVNHAGGNNVQEAIASGIPMLCLPFFADQPFNAAVVEALGLGRSLPPQRATRHGLASVITSLLDDEGLAARAKSLMSELIQLDSTPALIEILLALVNGRLDAYLAHEGRPTIEGEPLSGVPCA